MNSYLDFSRVIKGAMLIALVSMLGACATGPKVSYQDPKGVETVNANFGSTDLQSIAEAMTRSLLQSKAISASREAPLVTVAPVKNKTSEYIDTRMITTKIETQLLKSGQVRFAVRASDMQNQVNELNRQNSGLYNQESAAKLGNMQGAKYRIEGEIGSIVKSDANVKDVFYNFSLRLINNETGTYEWADEKEIRKQQTR
jgi:uncharacterized protein (TIGR02722 family)